MVSFNRPETFLLRIEAEAYFRGEINAMLSLAM